MEQTKIETEKSILEAKEEAMKDMASVANSFRLTFMLIEDKIHKINSINDRVLDILDRLTFIETCLKNKGFLEEEVVDSSSFLKV